MGSAIRIGPRAAAESDVLSPLEGDLLCHEAVWFQEVMVYWSVGIGTLATWCQEPTHWKRVMLGKIEGNRRKGNTEDEMVGWHH